MNIYKDKNLTAKLPEEMPMAMLSDDVDKSAQVDMNEVVGSHNILFVCLDTLRWDVALQEQENGGTPVLNGYGEQWQKRSAPGNFTYPSHHAMFTGFLPSDLQPGQPMNAQERLFFPSHIGLGHFAPKKSFAFEGATIMEGLAKVGYETICIGGVAFFDKRSAIGSVFPNMFRQSHWHPSFACGVKKSSDNQIEKARQCIEELPKDRRFFMYINIDAIHYPNNFYLEGEKQDSKKTHAAALRYVDERLPKLFSACKLNGPTFVIVCSDHGSCYGEDGYVFHGFNHPIVNTVPYKHFFL